MSGSLQKEDLKTFVPFQHTLQISNPIDKVDFQPSDEFDVQVSNIKNILSNALDVNDYRKVQQHAMLPEETLETMYNDIAQVQLEKKMLEMRGRKFEVRYDHAPDINDSLDDGPSF